MGIFGAIDRFIKRHSFFFNVSTNVLLATISLICYALLIILFLKPTWLQLRSLVHIEDNNISPTVVIGLITILLSGSTATLLTRAVEHSLWLKLVPREIENRLTVAESQRLAQWSVSALSRVLYLFTGKSWLLRFGGILLLATATVSPVLLSGVNPIQNNSGTSFEQPHTLDPFTGFLDRGNRLYNGGNFRDNPMEISALAAMSNVSAPASLVCTSASCRVTAISAAIFATCNPYVMDNPNGIGLTVGNESQTFCSTVNPNLCLDLTKSNPATYVNFTTGAQGPASGCSSESGSVSNVDCPGEWASLFGVWVNSNDGSSDTPPIYGVDCVLQYGNITVTQNGTRSPNVDRSSFEKSSYALETRSEQSWHRIYFEGVAEGQNPYSFSGSRVATGGNTLYSSPVGSLLLNYGLENGTDAEVVARQIEKNFDMATLFAFAKQPDATDRTIMITESTTRWEYQPEVLAVLAIPLLATLLVMIGRWRVGDHEEVVGYDPVEIARRGPVLQEGLMGQSEEISPYGRSNYHDDDADEKLEVWTVRTNGRGEGRASVRTRLVTG